jgi:imidazole glycerol phosphate synthase glutamine amidotransferase subunit
MSAIAVVPTGTANLASVMAAFRRLGVGIAEAKTAHDVSKADGVVLPGVGAFGAAMERIDALGLRKALLDRIEKGRPTLLVCLGMQLLCRSSEENPDSRGLGVIDATVGRFDDGLRVPQLGWNEVAPRPGSRFLEPGWAYFANSYRLTQAPEGWIAAYTDYGRSFVSAMERGEVLACQFHPELSGAWGWRLLSRWLDRSGVTG